MVPDVGEQPLALVKTTSLNSRETREPSSCSLLVIPLRIVRVSHSFGLNVDRTTSVTSGFLSSTVTVVVTTLISPALVTISSCLVEVQLPVLVTVDRPFATDTAPQENFLVEEIERQLLRQPACFAKWDLRH